VAVRFPGGGACRSEERVWGLDWWGGAAAGGLRVGFIEREEGERGRQPGAMAFNAMASRRS
jgi:hypothetical protein